MRNKKQVGESIFCGFLTFFCLYACSTVPEKQIPELHRIIISSMQFNPAELTLQKGDTVEFINRDMVVHDIAQDPDKNWSSAALPPGHSYKIAIEGSANYFCTIHPVMKGRLIVR